MTSIWSRKVVIAFSTLVLLFVLEPGPIAAAPGGSNRIVKTLKRQIAALKQQIASLNRQLAIERQPAPFIEMVTVGNPGNSSDQDFGVGAFGAVSATFRIGKFEVTNAQYVAFLNAVAADDTHGLYNNEMGNPGFFQGGITRFGSSPNYKYATRSAMGDKPVNYVSWFDAARFCNWLHNGQPTGAQDANTTETGAYTLNGAISGVGFTRQSSAKFWIPTLQEWHKAAYHQPASAGGDLDNYWLYPTRSNTIPTVATANPLGEIDNDNGNLANYDLGADWNGVDGNLTAVGSGGTGSASFYGAFDLAGNVEEWIDVANVDIEGGPFQWTRGGGSGDNETQLRASQRGRLSPASEFVDIGFRVATTTE